MKTWRRLPFTLLALCALLLTLVPQTVWACPMTGRVDVASRVCIGAVPMTPSTPSGAMPCAKFGGKCCHPVSAPPTQTDDDNSGRPHVFAAANHVSFVHLSVAPITDAAPFVPSQIESPVAPALRFYLARFANSPPPIRAFHHLARLAGRAPPTL